MDDLASDFQRCCKIIQQTSSSSMPTSLSRRTMLKAGAAFTASLSLGLRRARATGEIIDAAQKVHDEIWRRFVDELQPRARLHGFRRLISRATAQECREGKPNALAGGPPSKTARCSTVFYLDAAVHRWKVSARRPTRKRPGAWPMACSFSPRSARLASSPRRRRRRQDALPHGSNDQTSPWFHGLWRFLREGMATPEERERIVGKWSRSPMSSPPPNG